MYDYIIVAILVVFIWENIPDNYKAKVRNSIKFTCIVELTINTEVRYAIRRGYWPIYVYKDIVSQGYWWSRRSNCFEDCLVKDKQLLTNKRVEKTDYGKPVD